MDILPSGNIPSVVQGSISSEQRIALPAPQIMVQVNLSTTLSLPEERHEFSRSTLSPENKQKSVQEKIFLEIEVGGKKEKIEIPITSTRLKLDEETKRIVIQILNANNEVMKQIPPEEWLRFLAKWQKIQGLFFDELA